MRTDGAVLMLLACNAHIRRRLDAAGLQCAQVDPPGIMGSTRGGLSTHQLCTSFGRQCAFRVACTIVTDAQQAPCWDRLTEVRVRPASSPGLAAGGAASKNTPLAAVKQCQEGVIFRQISPADLRPTSVTYLGQPADQAPLHHCTIAPLHHCTTAPLHHCAIAPLRHCAIAPCIRPGRLPQGHA
jgi:hypothetical protein